MKLFNIKQYIPSDFCLSCFGCCRYNCKPSIWSASLLDEEKRALNLQKIELVAHQQLYVCCFLNPENNLCQIYYQRPLECHLYPFLLNRSGKTVYLSIALSCPFSRDKTNSRDFRRYLDYLIRYLQKPSVLAVLRNNRQVFSSYPSDEVLNLAELIM